MGLMWKYEPEDHGDDKKKHLKGNQFTNVTAYTPAVTSDGEFDNDGSPIFSDKAETKAEYGKRTAMNERALRSEHKF